MIAAGASAAPVTLGTWTAVNGKFTVRTVIAADANELSVKQANNTSTQSFFVGRGANMPYDTYEGEDGVTGGGAAVVGPNRTVGDLAGEASGRKAVTLNSTGSYVQWTTKAATNTLVTRFSVPDGTSSSLNIYVNGTLLKPISLTSKYAWLYGNETSPGNDPAPVDRGTSTTRPMSFSGRPFRPEARSSSRRTRRTAAPSPSTSSAWNRPLPSPTRTRPSTPYRPGSPTATCRTHWTGSGWTPPERWSACTCGR